MSTSRRTAVAALLLSLAGAGLSVLLLREHFAVNEGEVAQGLFCGGGGRFDCTRVASHESSWMLGVPLAAWGLAFYTVLAGLSLIAPTRPDRERAAASTLGVTLAAAALFLDGYLGFVMIHQIGAVCPLCLATYGLNALLAVSFGLDTRRCAAEPSWRALFLSLRPEPDAQAGSSSAGWPKLAIAALALAGLSITFMVCGRSAGETRQFATDQAIEFLRQTTRAPEVDMSRFQGLPGRGPRDARLTIVVSSDFECSFCRALAVHLERLREEHPDKIRILFLNSPISSTCNPSIRGNFHESACWLAEVAECAAAQGKFWPYHDYLFGTLPYSSVNRSTVERHLATIGLDVNRVRDCLGSGAARAALEREVALSRQYRLYSTPSIVINGYPKRRGIYPGTLRAVVRTMLED